MIPSLLSYAQKNKIPITAVNSAPEYSETKQRVTKGKRSFTNLGWEKGEDLNMEYVTSIKAFGVHQPTFWYLLIEKANLFVIDVDVVGNMTGQEALTDEAYTRLFEASNYVVQTGSGGLHFYFQKGECDFEFKKKVDIPELQHWFKPGVKGGIDIITQFIAMEGSSYQFQGKTYSYTSIKPGGSIATATYSETIWEEVKGLYDTKPINVVVNPEEEYSDRPPIVREALRITDKNQEIVQKLISLLKPERADNYKKWIEVGFVLRYYFGDLEVGEDLFKEFSSQSHKYREHECQKTYYSIVPKANGLRLGSLYRWAKEDNPEGYKDAFGFRMTWSSLDALNQNECAKCYTGIVQQDYVFSGKTWFRYTEHNTLQRLEKTHPDALKRHMSDTLQQELHSLVKKLNPTDENYLKHMKLAGGCHKTFGSSQWISGVIDYVRGIYTDDDLIDQIDTNMNLLAFSNGVLFDYETKELRKIERDDKVVKTTKKPLGKTSNPVLRAFLLKELKNIFNTDELVQYWLETISMSLFRNCYEKLYCHTGSGGNGKGLLFTLLKEATGDYYYQAPNEFLTTTYKADAPNSTLANARGIRIFVTSEPSSENNDGRGIKLGTDLIKALTGGDDINARDLYESAKRPYKPTFTTYLQCNVIPDFTKIDGGLRRRFEKMDYPNKFVESPTKKNEKQIDVALKEKLQEYENVNEFMLLLLDTAKEFTGFHRPTSVKESTKAFLDDADKVLCWLEEKCEKVDTLPAVGERITKAQAHKQFKEDTGISMTPNKFHNQMKVNEVEVKKIGVEFYLLKRLPEVEAEEEE